MSRVRSYLTGQDRQAQAKRVHDELALEPILKAKKRTSNPAIMDRLREHMDQSDGITPSIIASEFPEFEAFAEGSLI